MPSRPSAIRTLGPQPAPPGIYASRYTPELGAAVCRRVAAGESLRAICRADPAMPTGKTVWNWRRAHPEFALMLAHAQGVARERSLAAQAERDAARREARRKNRSRPAWNAGLSGFSVARQDAICGRIAMGESLTEVCGDPDMPSIGTVYNWLRAEPGFVAAYRLAREVQAEVLIELASEAPPPAGRGGLLALRRRLRAAERRMGALKLRRYAPPEGPAELDVRLEEGGRETLLYSARRG